MLNYKLIVTASDIRLVANTGVVQDVIYTKQKGRLNFLLDIALKMFYCFYTQYN